jgi:hypothetical protein
MPRPFGFFFQIKDLDSRLGGCGIRVIDGLFLNSLEDKERTFKTNLTLSLILRFNLRLGVYSIWSAIFIASHIKEYLKLLGHEHRRASKQPRKYSEDTFKMEFHKNLKTTSKVLESLQYWTTKSSGACQTWVARLLIRHRDI